MRKKKHLGEFTQWGFRVVGVLNPVEKDKGEEAQYDAYDHIIEKGIEGNGCLCGGGFSPDSFSLVVELGGNPRSNPRLSSPAKRRGRQKPSLRWVVDLDNKSPLSVEMERMVNWFKSEPSVVNFKFGPLEDLYSSFFEDDSTLSDWVKGQIQQQRKENHNESI